jgi:hypothetical protein
MIRSFLNVFLPEDEHKRTRILYFMAETTFLTVVFLLLFGLMKYILNLHLDTDLLVMISPFLMMAYVYFRYIFSGIEFTDVANKGEYKKQRHVVVKRSLLFGVVFLIIQFIVKETPTNYVEGIELIALPIIAILFYFLFDYISLKRSYKKNRELTDD